MSRKFGEMKVYKSLSLCVARFLYSIEKLNQAGYGLRATGHSWRRGWEHIQKRDHWVKICILNEECIISSFLLDISISTSQINT